MAKRVEIMLAQKLTPKLLERMKPPYLVQPKFNGDRCRALIWPDRTILLSSQGNERISVPHINNLVSQLKWPAFCPQADYLELDGELYKHGMRFQDIRSIVGRSVNLHLDYHQIEYHIFDIANARYFSGSLMRMEDRLEILQDIYTQLHMISIQQGLRIPAYQRVPTICAHSLNEIMELTAEFMRQGYEGSIVRDRLGIYGRCGKSGTIRSPHLLKVKPRIEIDCLIIGTQEEVDIKGNPKGTLGAFTCLTPAGIEFNVGSGRMLTKASRYELWKERSELEGHRLLIKYQELTKAGVPYAPTVEDFV